MEVLNQGRTLTIVRIYVVSYEYQFERVLPRVLPPSGSGHDRKEWSKPVTWINCQQNKTPLDLNTYVGERIRKHNPNRYVGVPIKMVESLDLSLWRVPSWTDIVYVANDFCYLSVSCQTFKRICVYVIVSCQASYMIYLLDCFVSSSPQGPVGTPKAPNINADASTLFPNRRHKELSAA